MSDGTLQTLDITMLDDVGTGANQLIQLDSNAKIPACSAAAVTGLSSVTKNASDPAIDTNPSGCRERALQSFIIFSEKSPSPSATGPTEKTATQSRPWQRCEGRLPPGSVADRTAPRARRRRATLL